MALLDQLTFIAIVMLGGFVISVLCKKFRFPDLLFLIIFGLLLSQSVSFIGLPIELPDNFISILSIITLILIVFDSTSHFKFKKLDAMSYDVFKITFITVFLNFIFLFFFAHLIIFAFDASNIFISMIFAALMSATSPSVILSILEEHSIIHH